MKIGERVGALRSLGDGVAHLYGYGEYLGDFVPDETAVGPLAVMAREAQMTVPKIKLESGQIVWGCECWWGPVEQIQKRIKGVRVEQADIDFDRAEALGTPPGEA